MLRPKFAVEFLEWSNAPGVQIRKTPTDRRPGFFPLVLGSVLVFLASAGLIERGKGSALFELLVDEALEGLKVVCSPKSGPAEMGVSR